MNKIDERFIALKARGQKAFIAFVTAGDPDLNATGEFVKALDRGGSDIIEIGIPFSDPVADGPVIQAANLRAMEKGIDLEVIFSKVEEIRNQVSAALVFLIYSNMIYHFGVEKFFKSCHLAGVDGVIVPDMPVEEMDEFESVARDYQVHMIRLVSPTSKGRTEKITEGARGFLYCVSSMGITGVREEIKTNLQEMFSYIKKGATLPTALGFGIATPEQALELKAYADGIIVGSALVKIIETYKEEATSYLEDYAIKMNKVLKVTES